MSSNAPWAQHEQERHLAALELPARARDLRRGRVLGDGGKGHILGGEQLASDRELQQVAIEHVVGHLAQGRAHFAGSAVALRRRLLAASSS